MDRRHALPLFGGGALFVAAVLLVLSRPAADGTDLYGAAGLVVAVVGLALSATGFSRYLSARRRRHRRRPRRETGHPSPAARTAPPHTEIETRAMLRAMIATASSDGSIDDSEIATIQRVFCDITGEAFDPVLFESVKSETLSPDYVIRNDLKLKHSPISPEMRRRILMACYNVVFADGSVQSAEIERITAIGHLFGLDSAESQEIMRTAREDYLERHSGG